MDSVRAVGFGIAQAGTAYAVGSVVDVIGDNLLQPGIKPAIRAFGQFSVGLLVLGEVVRGLGGRGMANSPFDDGLMMFFFYTPQQGMLRDLELLRSELVIEANEWFGTQIRS